MQGEGKLIPRDSSRRVGGISMSVLGVLGAVALSMATVHDAGLIERLDADYRRLLDGDPAQARLRQAEQLLEQTDQSGRWTNYLAATRIFRQVRSKAAVPLMLKYMIPDSEFGSTGSVDTYAETIFLLTGHDIGDPFSGASTTDRPKAVRQSVERLYVTWWQPNQASLTTDFAKWPRASLERYVDRLLSKVGHGEPSSPDATIDAYHLYHVIKYRLDRLNRPGERGWFDEELHPAMLPIMLDRAGYIDASASNTSQSNRTSSVAPHVAFNTIGFLAKFREDGVAGHLDEIATDERQGSSVRLACVLALHVAGEDLLPEVLLSILKTDHRLEPRLTSIVSLMLCKDAQRVGPTLIELLDDPNVQVRASAICALYGSLPPEALPKLATMMMDKRLGRYRSFLLDLIAEYKNEEAIRILAEHLKKALADPSLEDDIYDTFGALETASGMRWGSAGAHDSKYYREKSEQALAWYRQLKAYPKKPWAADEYQDLLRKYQGETELPGGLLDAYGRFAGAAANPTQQSIREFCLDGSVTITTEPRPRATIEHGQDLNLAFLKGQFDAQIIDARQLTADIYQIRTATSYLRFVKTASSGWKLYAYGDKRID